MQGLGYSAVLVRVRQIVVVGFDVEVPVEVQPRKV